MVGPPNLLLHWTKDCVKPSVMRVYVIFTSENVALFLHIYGLKLCIHSSFLLCTVFVAAYSIQIEPDEMYKM